MISEKIAEIYHTNGAGGELTNCPGENSCDRFKSAAGTTREDKEQNACTGCHLFETKPHAFERTIGEREFESIFTQIENMRRERDSGAAIDLKRISYLEWRLMLIADESQEREERALRLYAKALFEALAARSV